MHRILEFNSPFLNDYNLNYKNKVSLNYSPSILQTSNSSSNSYFDYYGNIESMTNPTKENDLGNTNNNGTDMKDDIPDVENPDVENPNNENPAIEDNLDSEDSKNTPKHDTPISTLPITKDLIDKDKKNSEANNDCMFNGTKIIDGQCYPIELGDNIPCNGLILPVNDNGLPSDASIKDTADAAIELGQECKNNPKKMGCWYAKGTEINDKMVSSKLDSKAMWCPGNYGYDEEEEIDNENKVYAEQNLDWDQFHKGCSLSNNFKIDMNTLAEQNKNLNQSIQEYNQFKEQALNESKTATINQNKAVIIKNSDTGEIYWLNNQGNLKSLPKGKTIKDIEACNQGQQGYIQELKTDEEIKAMGPIDTNNDNDIDICTANGVSVATTQGMLDAQQKVESSANQLQNHLNCMLNKDYQETAEIKQKKHVITQYLNRIRLEREVFQKNRDILEKGRAQSAQDKIAYVSNYYWMIIWGIIILYIMYRIVK